MKTVRFILFFSLCANFLLSLSGCNKEEVMHHEQAGAWKINSIETTYYDSGNIDSTATTTDAGVLLLWDNHSSNDNICEYEFFKPAPSSIYDVAGPSQIDPQKASVWWHAGPGSNDRLTLWYDSPGADAFVIYTASDITRETMTLTYVRLDAQGTMSIKEVWKLESH